MWRGSLDTSYESQWIKGTRMRTIDQQTGFVTCKLVVRRRLTVCEILLNGISSYFDHIPKITLKLRET